MNRLKPFKLFSFCILTAVTASVGLAAQSTGPRVPVAAGGKALAVIVLGEAGGDGAKFAANELQKYLRALSGVEVPVVNDRQSQTGPAILIGGPDQNQLVKQMSGRGLNGFAGLKSEGFVLKTSVVENRPVLVAGGNDDAGTMYAVFELLQRMGVAFLLTGDVVPERRASLEIPSLDVRMEPAIAQRGFLMEASHHVSVTILSYQDYVRMLDQMAKMKYNDLKIWWFAYSPFLKFSYRGEAKQIGDISTKESGYLNSVYAAFGTHTTDDVTVGKHWFPQHRLAPAELQHVETPDEAYTAAQDMLRRVIHYAKSRHIRVWLVDEMSVLPPNLARYGERLGDIPFNPVYGTYMHPLDPVNREIQAIKLKALIDTYPEAAGYLLNFSEIYVPQNNPKHRDFYAQQQSAFQALRPLMLPWADRLHVGRPAMIDSDIGNFDLFKYLLAKRDEFAPKATIGLMTVGRGYVMPLFDKMLPKDIPFVTFDTGGRCGYGTPQGMPMSYFGGMGARERTLSPYLDDDCDMLGMQFNVGTYVNKDRIFADGVKYGLTGVTPWMAQPRGTEQNSSFLAEADWNPNLTLEQFYKSYSERIFGSKAASLMYQAFMTLEDNQTKLAEESPGFGSDISPITIGCCGLLADVRLVYAYSQQPNPFDGPKDPGWTRSIMEFPSQIGMFETELPRLERALQRMRAAEALVDPRGKAQLAYLINRTESYRDAIRFLVTERKALMAFDEAFRKRSTVSEEEFVAALQASLKLFNAAADQARMTTSEYAEIIDFPSDLETLYNLNIEATLGYDLVRQWMETIVNFHMGRPYTRHIPFEQLFPQKNVQVVRQAAVQ